MSLDVQKLRNDFPALQRKYKKKPVVYFDNACMTAKPKHVTDAIMEYYHEHPGCHGRTNHLFGAETTKSYEESRRKIQGFFNAAHPEEIIFMRNSTEGINFLANTLDLKEGDTIVSSDIEHNSNLLPWQILEKKKKIKRLIIPTKDDTTFDLDLFTQKMSPAIKLVSMLLTSNLSGITFPIKEITEIAHANNALVCLDAAQSSLYYPLDLKDLDVDFMVTSLHKMWGPSGFGILYGKRNLLEKLPQFLAGGETISDSTYTSFKISRIPDKFEAGLQNYGGANGAGATIDYIKTVGRKNIYKQIIELNTHASEILSSLDGVKLIGPEAPEQRSSIINFFIDGISASDVSRLLNESSNIMTRFGKHCVHSWFNSKNHPESLRISFSAYNTLEEVDMFGHALKKILKYFRQ